MEDPLGGKGFLQLFGLVRRKYFMKDLFLVTVMRCTTLYVKGNLFQRRPPAKSGCFNLRSNQ